MIEDAIDSEADLRGFWHFCGCWVHFQMTGLQAWASAAFKRLTPPTAELIHCAVKAWWPCREIYLEFVLWTSPLHLTILYPHILLWLVTWWRVVCHSVAANKLSPKDTPLINVLLYLYDWKKSSQLWFKKSYRRSELPACLSLVQHSLPGKNDRKAADPWLTCFPLCFPTFYCKFTALKKHILLQDKTPTSFVCKSDGLFWNSDIPDIYLHILALNSCFWKCYTLYFFALLSSNRKWGYFYSISTVNQILTEPRCIDLTMKWASCH